MERFHHYGRADGVSIRGGVGVAYSVGPDMDDNEGAVVYDPTEGPGGGGDIVATF